MEKKVYKNPPTVLKLKRAIKDRLLIELSLSTDNQEMYDELYSAINKIVAKHLSKLDNK